MWCAQGVFSSFPHPHCASLHKRGFTSSFLLCSGCIDVYRGMRSDGWLVMLVATTTTTTTSHDDGRGDCSRLAFGCFAVPCRRLPFSVTPRRSAGTRSGTRARSRSWYPRVRVRVLPSRERSHLHHIDTVVVACPFRMSVPFPAEQQVAAAVLIAVA